MCASLSFEGPRVRLTAHQVTPYFLPRNHEDAKSGKKTVKEVTEDFMKLVSTLDGSVTRASLFEYCKDLPCSLMFLYSNMLISLY